MILKLTRHGIKQIKRTRLLPDDLVAIFDRDLCISLDPFCKTIEPDKEIFILWSVPDQEYFAVIRDRIRETLVTILPPHFLREPVPRPLSRKALKRMREAVRDGFVFQSTAAPAPDARKSPHPRVFCSWMLRRKNPKTFNLGFWKPNWGPTPFNRPVFHEWVLSKMRQKEVPLHKGVRFNLFLQEGGRMDPMDPETVDMIWAYILRGAASDSKVHEGSATQG